MLDHIEDLRKLSNKDINDLVGIFEQSFSTAVDNPRYRSSFEFALLIDIAQNLREMNKKQK